MRLQPALKLVRQPRHRTLERVELLVEIGAQPFELGRFGQILGKDLLVVGVGIDDVVGIGRTCRGRRRRFERGLAFGQFGLVAHLGIGQVVGGHLRLARVHLLLLRLLGRGVHLLALAVAVALGFGVFLILGAVLRLILVVILAGVGIVAKLVAVTQVGDHLPGKAREGRLIVEFRGHVFQRPAGRILDEPAPESKHVLGARGQGASGGHLPDHVACGGRKRRIRRLADLRKALACGLGGDLGVDVARGARHRARAHGLAAGLLHRGVKLARHLAFGLVAVEGARVVIAVAQRQGVGGAARQKDLVAGHPPRHLGQAHLVAGQTGRVDRIADRELRIVGHDLGGLGQRLLERVRGIV